MAMLVLVCLPRASEARLSGEQARSLVQATVIDPHPLAPQMVGFFYHQSDPTDQVLLPGLPVTDVEGTTAWIMVEPSYFFWIDVEPDKEWMHEALFVFVGADSGELTVLSGNSWPVIADVEHMEFTRAGNASPDLFHGAYPQPGPIFSFSPVDRDDTSQWAIIVVGRNAHDEVEKRARVNDLARIKDYLNGNERGPKIPEDNITAVTGADTLGATKQEVCDAIDALKGRGCEKVWFFYIGHGGNESYMALKKPDRDSVDELKYKELARKLLGLGDTEVCVVIEACHSGDAVDDLKKTEVERDGKDVTLKGSIITSSSAANTTSRGPDGSYFWKALHDCANDPLSDFDGDGHITLLEALAWARDNSSIVEGDSPQAEGLGDKREVRFAEVRREFRKSGSFDGVGSLEITIEKHSYRIKNGSSAGRDTTICRSNLYVENPSGSKHEGTRTITVRFYDREGNLLGEHSFVAELKANQKVCLARAPDGWKKVTIESEDDEASELAWDRGLQMLSRSSLPRTRLEVANETLPDLHYGAFRPGEFVFDALDLPNEPGVSYATSVESSLDWALATSPASWLCPMWVDKATLFLRGRVPMDALQGQEIRWYGYAAGGDSLVATMNAMVFSEDFWPCADDEELLRQAVSTPAVSVCSGAELRLDHSCISLSADATMRVDATSRLSMHWATLQADSAVVYDVVLEGTLDLDHADIVQPTSVLLEGATGSVHHLSSFNSQSDGLVIKGDAGGLDMSFVLIVQPAGDGLSFQGAADAEFRNVSIENAAGSDVVVDSPHALTLVDADFDDAAVDVVDVQGHLVRAWSVGIVVRGGDGSPLDGATVSVTDSQGDEVVTGHTNGEGALDLGDLQQYVRSQTNNEARTPHTVQLSYAGRDTTFSHAVDRPDLIRVGWSEVDSGTDVPPPARRHSRLVSVVPNPFNPRGSIRFVLAEPSHAEIDVFDVRGRHVRQVLSAYRPAGEGRAEWDGTDGLGQGVGSGVYLFRLRVPGTQSWQKAVLVR